MKLSFFWLEGFYISVNYFCIINFLIYYFANITLLPESVQTFMNVSYVTNGKNLFTRFKGRPLIYYVLLFIVISKMPVSDILFLLHEVLVVERHSHGHGILSYFGRVQNCLKLKET